MSESSAGILTSRYGALILFSHPFKRTAGILQGQRGKDKSSEDYRPLRFCRDKKKKKIIMGVAIIHDLASFFASYRPRFFFNCDVVD